MQVSIMKTTTPKSSINSLETFNTFWSADTLPSVVTKADKKSLMTNQKIPCLKLWECYLTSYHFTLSSVFA